MRYFQYWFMKPWYLKSMEEERVRYSHNAFWNRDLKTKENDGA